MQAVWRHEDGARWGRAGGLHRRCAGHPLLGGAFSAAHGNMHAAGVPTSNGLKQALLPTMPSAGAASWGGACLRTCHGPKVQTGAPRLFTMSPWACILHASLHCVSNNCRRQELIRHCWVRLDWIECPQVIKARVHEGGSVQPQQATCSPDRGPQPLLDSSSRPPWRFDADVLGSMRSAAGGHQGTVDQGSSGDPLQVCWRGCSCREWRGRREGGVVGAWAGGGAGERARKPRAQN